MKARKSASRKVAGKLIKISTKAAKKVKRPLKTVKVKKPRTMTAYELALQHNADLRFALMQIRDMEQVGGTPGMRSGNQRGPSFEAAREIARAALEKRT